MSSEVNQTSRVGLSVDRYFSRSDVHPYAEVNWERSDIRMVNWRDGTVNFEQQGVEFPDFWSESSKQIVTSKFFRGRLGTPDRESSLIQLLDRVVDTYVKNGIDFGYFATPEDARVFSDELKWLLLHQHFSFNSPVWFNVGTSSPQQVSACFLLSVEDTLESILNWYAEEGMIFKGGSGAGVNLSRIRSSEEYLSSGGTPSGPLSFMRGADASAGAIKSGGSTRRAAKLVCLDVDHPDIEAFVESKAREGRKIAALAAAGFDMSLDGADSHSVQYQNANNSVRVSDEFMRAVEDNEDFSLRARLTGEVVKTVSARDLFMKIAVSAWECADPGLQYDDTINSWNTCPESGRITTSNPCSEYMHLDNSSCNLASLNLLKFLTDENTFDVDAFSAAVELVITAMDISVSFADFPTQKITEVSRAFRQLGIGYANLGALLMSMGLAYDSDEGRRWAGSITSLMSAVSWRRSAELARSLEPYTGFAQNRESHLEVISRHASYNLSARFLSVGAPTEVTVRAGKEWAGAQALATEHGCRNAQVSLIAPTGTISFMMGCDTTGIEPDFALVKQKVLVGGGSMDIVNQSVPRALGVLGYNPEQIEAIVGYISDNGTVVGAPALHLKHYDVFDCAVGDRSIPYSAHLEMMASVQPFLSGAISKTINMPTTATVDEIMQVYSDGWNLGLKSVAIYRDGSKVGQPLSVKKRDAEPVTETPHPVHPIRLRMPMRRPSETVSFQVGDADGYLTMGMYPGNGPGEMFLKVGKQGSTLTGLLDAFSIAVSIALQYGVPLDVFVQKFTGMQFEPRGMTNDPDIRIATSLLDYVFRRVALDYLPEDVRRGLGVFSASEREVVVAQGVTSEIDSTPARRRAVDAPLCSACGVHMLVSGVCYVCPSCGTTSGCS